MSDIESRILFRTGKKSDCQEIRRLIQELADFENMPDGPKNTAKDLERYGFEIKPPLFECFVAEDTKESTDEDTKLVGYAIYYYAFSTWNGRKIFLEDLYVEEKFRNKGIGARLFKEIVKKSVAEGCACVDFTVLSWNPAKPFYESRGCVNHTESEQWNLYRLQGEALKTAAQSSEHRDLVII